MQAFVIRPARPEDAAALKELNDEFNGGDSDARHIAQCLADNPAEIVCIAELGATPAGYCCAQITTSICYMRPCAEITELYVRDEFRRRGIAAQLIRQAEAICVRRGAAEFRIVTGQGNAAAQALYRSAGYAAQDDIIFAKELLRYTDK